MTYGLLQVPSQWTTLHALQVLPVSTSKHCIVYTCVCVLQLLWKNIFYYMYIFKIGKTIKKKKKRKKIYRGFLTILWYTPDRLDWELSLTQFTVKGHNWFSLTYCDFNSYLVITRLIYEERLGMCYHKITQIMQFGWTNFYHSFISRKLSCQPWNVIKILTVMPGL